MPLLGYNPLNDGDEVPADNYDGIAAQAVIQCTSSTRPSSPHVGMTVFETDTFKVMQWNGIAWCPPWNLPWGRIGRGDAGSPATTDLMTFVDVTGMTVTWTTVANRRYWVEARGHCLTDQDDDSAYVSLVLTDGANAEIDPGGRIDVPCPVALNQVPFSIAAEFTPPAGSATAKLKIASPNGVANAQIYNVPTTCYLTVWDIGPNGAPA